jgi:hypothetical protein
MLVLRVGEFLIPPLFLLAAFMSWNTDDIWDKLNIIGIGGFLILGGALYELTKFDSKYSTIRSSHPISMVIFSITMLLIPALLVQEVLTHFHVHFAYHEALSAAFFFFFDLTLILCYFKIAKQIRTEKRSANSQEIHLTDAQQMFPK